MGVGQWLRQTFTGRNDTYLTSAMRGTGVVDPMRDFFTQHQRDDTVTRLNRYHKNWRFYNRMHFWQTGSITGDRKLVINYSRAICDKSTDWLAGKPFRIVTPEGNEPVGELLENIWAESNKQLLFWRAGQMGSVTGDAYLFATVPWLDDYGNIIPFEQQSIRIQTLNSAFVHPKFASAENRTIKEVLIQYPVLRGNFANITNVGNRSSDMCVYSQYISSTEIREFLDEQEIVEVRRPNPLGIVPLAHIQNLPHPGYFGISDIDDVVDINEEYNEVNESIRKIIKYQGEPTTIIFGAKVGDLRRGADKVWSGLPTDARVENLSLQASLTDAMTFKDSLKLAIHELSNTPESSLGKLQAISNTSDAALRTTYLPLIEKTQRKQLTYGAGVAQINAILLRILETYFGVDLRDFAANYGKRYSTTADFPSPLPQDDREITEVEIRRRDAGLQSDAGALRVFGEKNINAKAIELLADRRAKLLHDAEATKAAMGQMPNPACDSIGSLGMLPGVAETFEAQDAALDAVTREIAEKEAANAAAAAAAESKGGMPQ